MEQGSNYGAQPPMQPRYASDAPPTPPAYLPPEHARPVPPTAEPYPPLEDYRGPVAPHPPLDERRPFWKRGIGVLAAAAFLLVKFGAKLKGLLLLLPKAKIFTTSASMLVSIGAYALIWGWRFAVGFVLLLLVHEMGHVLQLRREGIKASTPLFIPFLGAAVGMKELPKDAAA